MYKFLFKRLESSTSLINKVVWCVFSLARHGAMLLIALPRILFASNSSGSMSSVDFAVCKPSVSSCLSNSTAASINSISVVNKCHIANVIGDALFENLQPLVKR